jgi:mannose-1-phosphate guanylyltransferase
MVKALILVGGFGTRLRPLTLSVPKPLVDFANRPMVVHQIAALKAAGCSEVVLAVNYQPERMMAFLESWAEKLGVKITCSREHEPMGTAGPLALAREVLDDGSGEPFFVLNSDVVCEYPFKELLEHHTAKGGECTIMVTKVDDPTRYGVVVMDDEGRVERFVEKPKTFVGDKINAGLYILNPSVLSRIELRPTSIEREVFPKVAADGRLFAMTLPGFWMDIGQPGDYLVGLRLYLESLRLKSPAELASGEGIEGNVLVHPSATVGAGCVIGPDVSIGEGCVVGDGVRLRSCTLFKGTVVGAHSFVEGSILGWESKIGAWNRVENLTILGEDVATKPELQLNGAIVLPHKELKESVAQPKIIL